MTNKEQYIRNCDALLTARLTVEKLEKKVTTQESELIKSVRCVKNGKTFTLQFKFRTFKANKFQHGWTLREGNKSLLTEYPWGLNGLRLTIALENV